MWWGNWKWCRQEKKKKVIRKIKIEKKIECDGEIENGVVKKKNKKIRKIKLIIYTMWWDIENGVVRKKEKNF